MSFAISRRETCRICGGADVPFFLDLGAAPFTDDFVMPEHAREEFSAPLSVAVCRSCWTAQTRHDVDVSDYYRDYNYSVAASGFAQRFMARLAEETLARYGFGDGARVLEVGSGDGAQLAHFLQRGARVLGFEPSADLCAASRAAGVDVAQMLFAADTIDAIPAQLRPADVVVLTYTFDHLPEPLPFLEAVRTVLDPARGVLVIEVHDLEQIMARRETCLFEHEHSIYLTSHSFRALLERAGFTLLTTELLPEAERRGNSLLVVAAPSGTEHAADPLPALSRDFGAWETYAGFGAEVESGHAALRDWVRARRAAGERVAGWGAGGRGVMTLAYTGLGPDDVAYLVDRNPHAHGYLAPGTHVPVVAPEHLDAEPVDHLIVFSYGYFDEIAAQVRDELGSDPQLVSVLDLLAGRTV
ncbi:MAG TPA: class I SAM-dependent methyltransferase [Baekduia sp.]|nr:class I SAM-dependent methyltransferase [Baekduia sp.]